MTTFKPILFNTDMVRVILDGRKTQTRRIIHSGEWIITGIPKWSKPYEGEFWFTVKAENSMTCIKLVPPCEIGDILWVRETWNGVKTGNPKIGYHTAYWYKADDKSENPDDTWRPSIHMPKGAARIFLRVREVYAKRLKDITKAEALAEGADDMDAWYCHGDLQKAADYPIYRFAEIWDKTIKNADLPFYGWAANPWVWVISFEQIDKPKEWR